MDRSKWSADYTNDMRFYDARLRIEIIKDETVYVARIDRVGRDLVLTIYATGVDVQIPVDWLLELLNDAERSLPPNG